MDLFQESKTRKVIESSEASQPKWNLFREKIFFIYGEIQKGYFKITNCWKLNKI